MAYNRKIPHSSSEKLLSLREKMVALFDYLLITSLKEQFPEHSLKLSIQNHDHQVTNK